MVLVHPGGVVPGTDYHCIGGHCSAGSINRIYCAEHNYVSKDSLSTMSLKMFCATFVMP